MTLVDSSAWIEYYRKSGHPRIHQFVYEAIRDDQAAINGIIQVEIAGFAREDERALILSDFSALHVLPLSNAVFAKAIEVCAAARKAGLTVPATDAIVAASALEADAVLVHRDGHFTELARLLPLRCAEAMD
jgi:predicted nucleic acid-binding protein